MHDIACIILQSGIRYTILDSKNWSDAVCKAERDYTSSEQISFVLFWKDKYILSSMSILVVICCWHAIVFAAIAMSGVNQNVVFWVDKWILVATGILYVAAHVTFFLFIYFGVS